MIPALLVVASMLPNGFTDHVIRDGLSLPMGLASLPDGRLLVTQRTGEIVIITLPGDADTIYVVPDVLATGEAGCSGIAVDPGWPDDPYVYVQYNMAPAQTGVAIDRYTATGALSIRTSTAMQLGDPYRILTAPDSTDQHNGGTLRFGPDGYLYSSLGDDVIDCTAQDSTLLQGVILRLKVSDLPPGPGGPPPRSQIVAPGNPFAPDTTDAELVYAMGLRNPFRFGIDPVTGNLYVADVGALEYEEVDEVQGGENYGWPWYEANDMHFFFCEGGPNAVLEWPIYDYAHTGANAIFGCVRYRRNGGAHQFPAIYDGTVFFGDTFQGWLRVLRFRLGAWDLLFPPPGQPDSLNWGEGLGFAVDLIQGADDALYYTSYVNGEVRRIIYGAVLGVDPEPPVPGLRAPSLHVLGSGPVRVEGGGGGILQVFDVRGRLVGGPVAADPSGNHTWRPEGVGPGVYFLRVRGTEGARGARIVLVR